mmetsp:Transcript_21350/g.33016  ORF Transcript_21350/g.33016 Transcript_21350/m.33016 type:complete len:91 (-) Transcript_21350:17-289(-)
MFIKQNALVFGCTTCSPPMETKTLSTASSAICNNPHASKGRFYHNNQSKRQRHNASARKAKRKQESKREGPTSDRFLSRRRKIFGKRTDH